MNTIVKAGIWMGVLCAIWTFVMGFTGWYKDPVMLNVFYVVILIEIGVLIWGLKKTAAEGRTYGGQLKAGTLMAVIGGVIVFCSSLLFTLVVFPQYFDELRAVYTDMLKAQGMSDADVAAGIETWSATQTPFLQALMGFIGTVVTGFVGSLIIGAVFRKK
jgi:hypothetical protein